MRVNHMMVHQELPEEAFLEHRAFVDSSRSTDLLTWQGGPGYYTRRRITYLSDKLPALSGSAKVLQQRTGYSYLGVVVRKALE